MGVLKSLTGAFAAFLGLFRSASPKAQPAVQPAAPIAAVEPAAVEPAAAVAVPAVAGYVHRETDVNFYLAARLASVAKLNTPNGRKPRGQQSRFAGLPPVPAERIGAKRTRIARTGPLIASTTSPARKTGIVIPFPLEKRRAVAAETIAEAA